MCWCTVHILGSAAWARRRYRRGLRFAGPLDARLGAVVVDYQEPAALCLPGVRRLVVLSTAAIEALDEAQPAAGWPMSAHQRSRHHLPVSLAGSLAAAFPRVPVFRHGHEQVARLVELLADDAAAAASQRLTVAEALLALSAHAAAAGRSAQPDPPQGPASGGSSPHPHH